MPGLKNYILNHKRVITLFFWCLFCLPAYALDIDKLLGYYQHFHQHPELSLQEKQTSRFLADKLKSLGFKVETHIGGYGLVATLENGEGKTIMFRTDMDALPIEEQTGLPFGSQVKATNPQGMETPVMHACGHDLHMTVFLGIAEQMAAEKDTWHGTLQLVAEPAEEIGAGAKALIADGLYSRFPVPDYNLAFHDTPELPAGTIGYVSGFALANVDSVDITIFGIGGHGAYPHQTRDPVVIASQVVIALQTIVSREVPPLEPAVVTVGSIHGGTKHNIIPDQVDLQLTVRTFSDETRELVLRRIKEISRGVARTAGMPEDKLPTVTVRDEYTPSVYNSPALVKKVVPILQAAMGSSAVLETPPSMAGEDFSRYGRTEHNIPSVMLWLGAANPGEWQKAKQSGESLPGLHSSRFAPDAEPAIKTGVVAMTSLLQHLFRDSE